jgi:hypothetical protein
MQEKVDGAVDISLGTWLDERDIFIPETEPGHLGSQLKGGDVASNRDRDVRMRARARDQICVEPEAVWDGSGEGREIHSRAGGGERSHGRRGCKLCRECNNFVGSATRVCPYCRNMFAMLSTTAAALPSGSV